MIYNHRNQEAGLNYVNKNGKVYEEPSGLVRVVMRSRRLLSLVQSRRWYLQLFNFLVRMYRFHSSHSLAYVGHVEGGSCSNSKIVADDAGGKKELVRS